MAYIPDFSQKHGRTFSHGMPYYAPTANTYFRSKELVDLEFPPNLIVSVPYKYNQVV